MTARPYILTQAVGTEAVIAGKHYREGVTILELGEMFPTEDSAREWFEAKVWPNGRHCPRCGHTETIECTGNPPMPYYCPGCKRHFSVRIGTVMERSKLPFRKWVWAIYLHLTSLKGVSSVKLGRDIGVRQATAWFMLQRIREAFKHDDEPPMDGPAEADEVYLGVPPVASERVAPLGDGRTMRLPSGKPANDPGESE